MARNHGLARCLVLASLVLFATAGFSADKAAPKAKYSAEQANKKITVVAEGNNPTSGWKNELTASPVGVLPPEFKLTQTAPEGAALQVIRAFTVKATVEVAAPVEHVFVTDGAGRHKVSVKQAQ